MSFIETRPGGNAPGLPGSRSLSPTPAVLSRRAALGATAAIALGLGSLAAMPAGASVAPLVAVSPLSADAGLIAFARQVAALAVRHDQAHSRAADIRSFIERATGFPPHRPTPSMGLNITTEVVDGLHVTTATRPAQHPERDAILAAHDRASAAYEKRRAEMQQRLGLPEVEGRILRMGRRIDRWTIALAETKPETPAGLGAKATALLALADDGQGRIDDTSLPLHAELLVAVLRDAARLGAGGQA